MNINLITSPKNRRYQKRHRSWYTAVRHLLQESAKNGENRLEDFLLTKDKINRWGCSDFVDIICWWHFFDVGYRQQRLNIKCWVQTVRENWTARTNENGCFKKSEQTPLKVQFDSNDRPLSCYNIDDHVYLLCLDVLSVWPKEV